LTPGRQSSRANAVQSGTPLAGLDAAASKQLLFQNI
jgi:hypothetical protein